MKKQSAGILLYRQAGNSVEVMLVHPGGPFWSKKDTGVWSIPKGEFEEGEVPIMAAKREFSEELGSPAAEGEFLELGTVRLSSGKTVYAWALHSDFDTSKVKSNLFSMEWPPKSGVQKEFPEIDRAAWFPLVTARQKIAKGQIPFLDTFTQCLTIRPDEPGPAGSDFRQPSLF